MDFNYLISEWSEINIISLYQKAIFLLISNNPAYLNVSELTA